MKAYPKVTTVINVELTIDESTWLNDLLSNQTNSQCANDLYHSLAQALETYKERKEHQPIW